MRETEVEELAIYRDGELAGRLTRTQLGCRFQYEPAFLGQPRTPPGVAFLVPPTLDPIDVAGVNLHPFFANLLPEGLRLAALIGRVRTSPDDLFTLFAEVGMDCVGDIHTLGPGPAFDMEIEDPANLDFAEVAERLRTEANDTGLPGVQLKLSASMVAMPSARRNCILKLAPEAFPNLAENEAECLALARRAGLEPAHCQVVHDRRGVAALLVSRFDRVPRRGRTPQRVHVEDGCQLCGRYPADKYRLTFRDVAAAVAEFATSPRREVLRLARLAAFSYLVGNSDLHAKNVALWVNPQTRLVELTPAYDIVCTLLYPRLETRMAMPIEGKDENLRQGDFVAATARFGVPAQAVHRVIQSLLETTAAWPDELQKLAPNPKDAARAIERLGARRRALEAAP